MNFLQRIEYVTLRLVRRFIVTERVARRLSGFIPYYRPSNNERQPQAIVDDYRRHLATVDATLDGRHVLEAGSGRTLLVAYALAQAGAAEVVALEPFVEFDAALDAGLIAQRSELAAMKARVRRVCAADDVASQSIDLLLSNSVLEHVADLHGFFADCRRVLAPAGLMLHIVDYRDHFFKYPYGFLTFRRTTWQRWLDPGDLPRWRVYDHVDAMHDAGFEVRVLDQQSDSAAFAAVQDRLAEEFAGARTGVDVTRAVLVARVATPAAPATTAGATGT